jgi:ABC-type transport system substrate-binding protein
MNQWTKSFILTALLASSSLAVAPKNTLVVQASGDITSLDPHQSFENNGFATPANSNRCWRPLGTSRATEKRTRSTCGKA